MVSWLYNIGGAANKVGLKQEVTKYELLSSCFPGDENTHTDGVEAVLCGVWKGKQRKKRLDMLETSPLEHAGKLVGTCSRASRKRAHARETERGVWAAFGLEPMPLCPMKSIPFQTSET